MIRDALIYRFHSTIDELKGVINGWRKYSTIILIIYIIITLGMILLHNLTFTQEIVQLIENRPGIDISFVKLYSIIKYQRTLLLILTVSLLPIFVLFSYCLLVFLKFFSVLIYSLFFPLNADHEKKSRHYNLFFRVRFSKQFTFIFIPLIMLLAVIMLKLQFWNFDSMQMGKLFLYATGSAIPIIWGINIYLFLKEKEK